MVNVQICEIAYRSRSVKVICLSKRTDYPKARQPRREKRGQDRQQMVPGFVQLGVIAVLLQLLGIGGFYGYLRYRHPVTTAATRRRVVRILGGSAALTALGQLVALSAIGSLRVAPLLSLRQAMIVQDAGLLVAVVGYGGVVAGFVIQSRG